MPKPSLQAPHLSQRPQHRRAPIPHLPKQVAPPQRQPTAYLCVWRRFHARQYMGLVVAWTHASSRFQRRWIRDPIWMQSFIRGFRRVGGYFSFLPCPSPACSRTLDPSPLLGLPHIILAPAAAPTAATATLCSLRLRHDRLVIPALRPARVERLPHGHGDLLPMAVVKDDKDEDNG
ncbi:hypothetical protein B0H19DRAFT_1272249 [Mycena capillaripes]|nr:hypothetical protein B0H19DRAFT_1272249 [Mycena capillaripes]